MQTIASEAKVKWSDEVRRAPLKGPRNRLREAAISLEALRIISKDTGQTRYAFEACENFPLVDVLRAWNDRLPVLRDERLISLYEERETPDLRLEQAVALKGLPEGTLGHAYARFVEARGLENHFLDYLEIESPALFLAHRTAHLHDLFHFVLGYEPYDPIGEMEVEAFLLAQTGGLHHVLFMLGYVGFLLRNDPGQLWRGVGRLREAFRLGGVAKPFLLQRWSELLRRPLAEVKASLGVSGRPEARALREPEVTPRLSHVVLNVPDLERALFFYTRVFGYRLVARDRALGAVFLSDGEEHHTVALQETPSLSPWGIFKAIGRARALYEARREGGRSRQGKARVLPPLGVVLSGLRGGVHHMGYRLRDDVELSAYLRRLQSAGARVVWRVNHGDLIHGVYVRDPAGNLIELFVDGPEVSRAKAEGAMGRVHDVHLPSYELEIEGAP